MTTAPKAGELFAGQYRVERVLGTGGMGVVLAAWDETNARGVALKVLQVGDPTSIERFHREARSMKKLSSDHVVRVLDAGTAEDGVPYLVMERLVGANLSEYLKQNGGRLGAQEVADVVIQACEALAHAHAAGIVHRDVKPSNLYVHDDKGRRVIKVLDFGISKQLTREEWEKTLTEGAEGGVLGSPPYMSPEHVRDPKNVDLRIDIWALGVLAHKLSTGVLPYDGDTVGEIFAKVLEAKPPPMPELAPRLRAVIERCLSRDRNARYPSAVALAEALAPLASEEIAGLVGSIPLVAAAEDEPRTLTVDHPPPLPAALPALPTPSSVTPPAAAIPSGVMTAPVLPPTRSRRGVAFGLAVVGIAIGVVIGIAVRRPSPATVTATPPPNAPTEIIGQSSPSLSPATVTATPPAASAPSPATVTVASATAPTTSKKGGRPRNGTGTGTGKPLTSTVAATPPTTAAAAAAVPVAPAPPSERPELQDNPYGKKP